MKVWIFLILVLASPFLYIGSLYLYVRIRIWWTVRKIVKACKKATAAMEELLKEVNNG